MTKPADKFERMERFFYKNPNVEVHLRGLAESLDCSPGFISKSIGSLVEENIVKEEKKGNMRTFTAKTSSTEYRNKKRGYNIEEVLTSGLPDYLENELYPDAIVLFGSYLKGMDTHDSDIDIAIINGREESLDLSSYEEDLERNVSLTKISSLDDAEPDFANTLANGLVLKGYLDVI